MHTGVSLPRVDDAVVVAVEEGDVLLQHAHVVVPVLVVRGAVGVVDVRRRQSSRQICSSHQQHASVANRAYFDTTVSLSDEEKVRARAHMAWGRAPRGRRGRGA